MNHPGVLYFVWGDSLCEFPSGKAASKCVMSHKQTFVISLDCDGYNGAWISDLLGKWFDYTKCASLLSPQDNYLGNSFNSWLPYNPEEIWNSAYLFDFVHSSLIWTPATLLSTLRYYLGTVTCLSENEEPCWLLFYVVLGMLKIFVYCASIFLCGCSKILQIR